jgi:hypothetical protein
MDEASGKTVLIVEDERDVVDLTMEIDRIIVRGSTIE